MYVLELSAIFNKQIISMCTYYIRKVSIFIYNIMLNRSKICVLFRTTITIFSIFTILTKFKK